MTTTLLLVRHGETIDNVNRIMQGQTQGELTETGVRQASNLAESLANTHIDIYMSSDLKRAYDTCRIIAGEGRNIIRTPLLRERDWGSFTGKYIPELQGKIWPDDIETQASMEARASSFLNMLRKKHNGKTILAVGHGIINKVIQAVFYSKRMSDIPRMENAEVRTLFIE